MAQYRKYNSIKKEAQIHDSKVGFWPKWMGTSEMNPYGFVPIRDQASTFKSCSMALFINSLFKFQSKYSDFQDFQPKYSDFLDLRMQSWSFDDIHCPADSFNSSIK